jgi:hypothetical protein
MRRRSFLQTSLLGVPALRAQAPVPSTAGPHPKLAAIVADYRIHSDADNLVTRFLEGFWINDNFHRSDCEIASLYVKRIGTDDIAGRLSTSHQIPLKRSISDALTLGTGRLAVDGVLLVAEDYGRENTDPDSRFDFFQEIVTAFRKGGHSVPVFCCGYLSSNWDHAKRMVEQSREMNFQLMAGAAETVTFRRPELEYPLPIGFDDAPLGDRAHHDYKFGVEFDGALVIISRGSQNLFSSFEILQSFLERRIGGETGIRSVEYLANNEVWQAGVEGRWSKDLMEAALGLREGVGQGRPEDAEHPELWLIEYNDGTRGSMLSLGNLVRAPLAALRAKGRREIDCTMCYAPLDSRNDFSPLVQGISQMVLTAKPPYPIERNLLTTGALSFFREAQVQRKRIETPSLQIAYTAPEHSFYAHGRGW